MQSVRFFGVAALLLATTACDEDALQAGRPDMPAAPAAGVQAYLQVSNDNAAPGQQVDVFVRVLFGADLEGRLGSYTGSLFFDPEFLQWVRDADINDGLRVVNPEAGPGTVMFAGASAGGFEQTILYRGTFRVTDANYMTGLGFSIEELTQAETLVDLDERLEMPTEIFLNTVGN